MAEDPEKPEPDWKDLALTRKQIIKEMRATFDAFREEFIKCLAMMCSDASYTQKSEAIKTFFTFLLKNVPLDEDVKAGLRQQIKEINESCNHDDHRRILENVPGLLRDVEKILAEPIAPTES